MELRTPKLNRKQTFTNFPQIFQVVIMLYEDPTKELSSDERFHVELHFSPGVNCCIHKDLPPGPGFRPHSSRQNNVENQDGPIQQGRFICTPEGVTGGQVPKLEIQTPQPPPPLVCSIKCSKDSFHKVFDSGSSSEPNPDQASGSSPITIKVSHSDPQIIDEKSGDDLPMPKVD